VGGAIECLITYDTTQDVCVKRFVTFKGRSHHLPKPRPNVLSLIPTMGMCWGCEFKVTQDPPTARRYGRVPPLQFQTKLHALTRNRYRVVTDAHRFLRPLLRHANDPLTITPAPPTCHVRQRARVWSSPMPRSPPPHLCPPPRLARVCQVLCTSPPNHLVGSTSLVSPLHVRPSFFFLSHQKTDDQR